MELELLHLDGYRGITTKLRMAPIVVLFGRNNAGKTNVLEALGIALSDDDRLGRHVPTELGHELPYQAQLVRLAHQGNPSDAEELARLLQFEPTLAQDTPAALTFLDGERPLTDSTDLLPLDELLGLLADELIGEFARACTDWPAARASVEQFVHELLQTEWFISDIGGLGIAWTLPPPDRRPDGLHEAIEQLASMADLWDAPHRFTRHLADPHGPGWHPFLTVSDELDPLYTAPVQYYRPGTGSDDDLLADIEDVIRRCWNALSDSDEPTSLTIGSDDAPLVVTFPGSVPGHDPWLDGSVEDGYRIADNVFEGCKRISQDATSRAPAFIHDDYDIVIRPLDPPQWRSNNNRRVRVLLAPKDGSTPRDLAVMGAGSALWTAYAITEALLRVRLDHDPFVALDTEVQQPRVYLIDEPEQHLHPLAQEQAAHWLADLARSGATVAITTHSPTFLNLPHPDVEYVAVRRHDGKTTTRSLGNDLLGELAAIGEQLGLRRADVLQLTNGVLLVEGEDDLHVIDHFYRQDLEDARIRILPLHGSRNTKRVFDSEFLAQAGLPLYVLLDNIRLDTIRNATSKEGLTEEEMTIWALLHDHDRDDITFLDYDEPDILCALPFTAVARRYPHLTPRVDEVADDRGYWSDLIAQWRTHCHDAGQRVDFKKWAATAIDLPANRRTVQDLLPHLLPDEQPSPKLNRAIKSMLAHATP